MDELAELQAQFSREQKKATSKLLSERCWVEIVQKLLELKLIQVVYTRDGKEYVTPEQLGREIENEIYAHGGRINIVDLPALLNIDLPHIERQLEVLMQDDSTMKLVHGDIITPQYLEGVVAECSQLLAENGAVTLDDLCTRFNLSNDMLLDCLRGRIDGVFDHGMVYTQRYVARHNAIVRGALSAITRPTPISQILPAHKLDQLLLLAGAQKLSEAGQLAGKVDRNSYVPAMHTQQQRSSLKDFFNHNGYIEYNRIAKTVGNDGVRNYATTLGEGKPLDTLFVAKQTLLRADAEIGESVRDNAWIDVGTMLPSSATDRDLELFVQECLSTSEFKQRCTVLGGRYLVSSGWISECVKKIEASEKERAASKRAPKPSPAPTPASTPSSALAAPLAKSGKQVSQVPSTAEKGGKKKQAAVVESDSDEEFRKSSAKKKGGDKGGKKKGSTAPTKETKGRSRGGDSDDEGEAHRGSSVNNEETAVQLKKWYPELGDVEDLLDALTEHLRPIIVEQRQAAEAVYAQAKSVSVHKRFADMCDKMLNLYHRVQAMRHSLSEEVEKETLATLEKHLLNTECTELANSLYNSQLLLAGMLQEGAPPVARDVALTKLPPKLSLSLKSVFQAVQSKSVEEFLSKFETAAEVCEVQLRPLDKKKERQIVFAYFQELCETLKNEDDPATALYLVVLALHAKAGKAFTAPPRCVPALLELLDKPPALLTSYADIVSVVLKASASGTDVPEEAEEQLERDLEQVKGLVIRKE